jgi:hypothetical protein
MDKCNAVSWRNEGSGWSRPPKVVNFRRKHKPRLWPWFLLIILALVIIPALTTWLVR